MSLVDTLRFITTHPLSSGGKARNLLRFASWQMQSRLAQEPAIFALVNGARMYACRGMTGATGNLYVGLSEFEEMAFLLHFLRPGELFVDAGANVGSYTVLAAAAVGAEVFAFEPSAEARAWLDRNVALNGVTDRVKVRQEALGSRSGTARFTIGLDSANHLLPNAPADEGAASETVPMTTLDEALRGKKPSMVKIDVEGFETEVLRGAAATLASASLYCVVLELVGGGARYGYSEPGVRKDMLSLGFAPYRYDAFRRRLSPREATCAHGNTLFLRDAEAVSQRLAAAKPFNVRGRSI